MCTCAQYNCVRISEAALTEMKKRNLDKKTSGSSSKYGIKTCEKENTLNFFINTELSKYIEFKIELVEKINNGFF